MKTGVLVVMLALAAQGAAALELRVNCGGGYCSSLDFGAPFSADSCFSGGTPYSVPQQWLLIDTNDPLLYATGRSGAFSYAFNVPNGWYIVRLGFCETECHAVGQRLMEIFCEGFPILSEFDIRNYRRPFYPLVVSRAVQVADGRINIRFSGVPGAIVSHVSVISSEPDTIPPATPSGFGVLGGFEAGVLWWNPTTDSQMGSYKIYRVTLPDSEAVLLEAIPYLTHWHSEESATPGHTYGYQVTAADVYGNESAPTAISWCSVLDHTSSQIPVYRLFVAPEDLQAMDTNPFLDTYYPATLVLDGQSHDVEVRYRGAMGRLSPKKSWKIRLPSDYVIPGRDHVNLNGESTTFCMAEAVLNYACFDSTVIPFKANAFKAHLELNDQYMGVYTDVEEMDRDFFDARGISPIGNLYDVSSRFEIPDSLMWEWLFVKMTNKDEGNEDVQEFVTYINDASEVEFPSGILDYLDLDAFLDYYGMNIMLMNIDFISTNIKIYHDFDTGLWTFHPWDLDAGFSDSHMPIDYGTLGSPQPGGGYNRLYNRVLEVPQFRLKYAERLRHFATNVMTGAVWGDFIDDLFDSIVFDGDRDVWKRLGVNNGVFHQCPALLTNLLNSRCAYVLSVVDGYADSANGIVINELMAINTSTIMDEHNNYDDWIEIHNIQDHPISVGGMYLTDDIDDSTKWALPDSLIPAGGHAIVWADNEPGEGPWHASFKLDGDGETIYLFKDLGESLMMFDGVDFGEQTADVSYARYPDGWVIWQVSRPTPGDPNAPTNFPEVEEVRCVPALPDSDDVVTVTTVAGDLDGDLKTVTLIVTADGAGDDYQMRDDGAHGDGQAGDGLYGAQFGPHVCGTDISYYVVARDSLGLETQCPEDAPDESYRYRTCAVLPALLINEFMASNDSTVQDEYAEYDDWVEVFNPGPDTVSLLGLHLSDDLDNPDKWEFPDTTLLPGQFLLVWVDDDEEQGALHTTFNLSMGGEQIGVFGSYWQACCPIDTVVFGSQETDVSFGRYPDGTPAWSAMYDPTPGSANSCAGVGPPGAGVERTDLGQPFPNPFADVLRLRFDVSSSCRARLSVYDVSGRLVCRLYDLPVVAGSYQAAWNGRDSIGRPVASGIYFAVLDAGGTTCCRKVVCLR